MKPDTRNIIVTLLLIASSLGIGRTGFIWHERLEEQATHIGDLERQIVEMREVDTALARDLAEARYNGASLKSEPVAVALPVAPVSEDSTVQNSDIDVAFLQSVVEQLSQNQQAVVSKPKTVQKTVTETPQTRSRTTRAS